MRPSLAVTWGSAPWPRLRTLGSLTARGNELGRWGISRRELSDRELRVVERVVDGLTNQEIADATGQALATVKKHLSIVMIKWDP